MSWGVASTCKFDLSGITKDIQMRVSWGVVFKYKLQLTFQCELGPQEDFIVCGRQVKFPTR